MVRNEEKLFSMDFAPHNAALHTTGTNDVVHNDRKLFAPPYVTFPHLCRHHRRSPYTPIR